MRLSRRRLLTLFGLAGLGGCGGRTEQERQPSPTSTSTSTSTPGSTAETSTTTTARRPSTPAVSPQSISLGNSRSEPTFVTVVVERAGETVFIESRELVPSERHTLNEVVSTGGDYDVVVETADGDRTTFEWTVVDRLDGLAVAIGNEIDLLRTSRCDGDCALVRRGETLDSPLVGDGSARWYAPAEVVLSNPGAATTASLRVALDGAVLVDAAYRVTRETQVVVPVTYRSGRYDVAVETDDGAVSGEWRVPEEPSRTVELPTLEVGCGPANTELRFENADVGPHAVEVTIAREGTVHFADRVVIGPGGRQSVVPVSESGRYDVTLRLDGESVVRDTWWACPPRGPATVVIDATGRISLQQLGL